MLARALYDTGVLVQVVWSIRDGLAPGAVCINIGTTFTGQLTCLTDVKCVLQDGEFLIVAGLGAGVDVLL